MSATGGPGRRGAEFAGLVMFFAVLICGDWVGYGASLAMFRLDPALIPDGFHVVLSAPKPDAAGERYVPVAWARAAEEKAALGAQTYRVPAASGSIPGPKTSYTFAVLEDDGTRQVVEVDSSGLLTSRSRYEAYAERVAPIGYKSFAWDYDRKRSWVALAPTLLGAVLAALITVYAVKRLSRPSGK